MIYYFNPSPSRPSLVLFAPVDTSYIRRERRRKERRKKEKRRKERRRKERRGVVAPEDTDNESED